MTGLEVALRSIMPAFEGVIPATIGKTTSNLDVNPFLAVRVVDPETMLEYEPDATRLRSERAGELFDSMRVQIDAIADQTGMRGVFRLRSVEVLRVDRCGQVEGSVGRLRRSTSGAGALDGLSVFVGRLDDCCELGELTQIALELLDDLFGIGSSTLLMADHDFRVCSSSRTTVTPAASEPKSRWATA